MTDEAKKALSVRARVNGQYLDIELKRHALPYFEADHGSALNTLQRLMNKAWQVQDITNVLNFAIRKQPAEGTDWMRYQMTKTLEKLEKKDKELTVIDEAIKINGPGHYAVLASIVLYAAVFGLDPEDAHFDDTEKLEAVNE
ncbi:hypothetical protein [Brucella pseudogrignonensis]|uniref:hypothetical protein n=1 Tax=Brucella pseudogrignonensis TaxID=419475 RepID=UPI003ECECDB8